LRLSITGRWPGRGLCVLALCGTWVFSSAQAPAPGFSFTGSIPLPAAATIGGVQGIIPNFQELDAEPVLDEAIAPVLSRETARVANAKGLHELVRTMVGEARDLPLTPEHQCLAVAVYFESRGEPIEGQLAVAQVVMNRVQDRRWPNTICGVVQQRTAASCQFSYVCDPRKDQPRDRRSWGIAKAVALIAAGGAWPDLTNGATHFHATRVNPAWNDIYRRTKTVGTHVFYRKPS
jgi:spore germination cell wall hydrolase CwlJ-like protein